MFFSVFVLCMWCAVFVFSFIWFIHRNSTNRIWSMADAECDLFCNHTKIKIMFAKMSHLTCTHTYDQRELMNEKQTLTLFFLYSASFIVFSSFSIGSVNKIDLAWYATRWVCSNRPRFQLTFSCSCWWLSSWFRSMISVKKITKTKKHRQKLWT